MAIPFRPYPLPQQESTTDQLNTLAGVLAQIASQRQNQKFLEQDRTLKTTGLRKDFATAVGDLGPERAKDIYSPAFKTMGIDPSIQAWNDYAKNRQTPHSDQPVQDAGSDSALNPDEQAYLADAAGFSQQRGRIEADRIQKGLQAKKLAKDLNTQPSKSLDQLAADAVSRGEMTLEQAMQMKRGPTEEDKLDARNKAKIQKEKPKALGSFNNTMREYDNMINEAKAIKDDTSLGMATGIASPLGSIPGTGAKRVSARLQTLKAKTLLNVLGSMKELSQTGASGFGQLSEIEGEQIRNSISTLDRGVATGDFKDSLDRFVKEMEARKVNLRNTYESTYGSSGSTNGQRTIGRFQVTVEP